MQRTEPEFERSATEQLAKESGHRLQASPECGPIVLADEPNANPNPNQ
jgi:hypothetical protein